MSPLNLAQLKQQKIAVLYGGHSAEREVSIRSGEAVAKGLTQAGFSHVELFDPKLHNITTLVSQGFERAFIALHGRGGEDGSIQGALESLAIPYTGSGVLGSALSMDKVRTKQIWQAQGLPTAAFHVVNKHQLKAIDCQQILDELYGKVIVKPAHEGSSIGMAIAHTTAQLMNALEQAFTFDDAVLIEQWVNGPEYTVAILGDQALPAIHMATPREFYDYQAKYQSVDTQYHCPCGLIEADEMQLQQLALSAFRAVGASGWGRVDVMRNEHQQWQLLEVNTVPGMTETSLVPKAAKVAGYSFEELVSEILALSAK